MEATIINRFAVIALAFAALGAAKADDADDAAFLDAATAEIKSNVRGLEIADSPMEESVLPPDEAVKFLDGAFAEYEPSSSVRQYADSVERLKRLVASGEYRLVRQKWEREYYNAKDDTESWQTNTVHLLISRRLWRSAYLSSYVFPYIIFEDNPVVGRRCSESSIYPEQAKSLLGPHAVVSVAKRATTNAVDAVVIADVETVDFDSLTGCAPTLPGEATLADDGGRWLNMPREKKTYRVGLYVRDVQEGSCDLRRIVFEAALDRINASRDGTWLFYRGMTLRVGLTRSPDGSFRIERIEPASPFPPYSTKGISLYESGYEIFSGFRRFSCRKMTMEGNDLYGKERGVFVEYPNSTLVAFTATTNRLDETPLDCYDFGEKAKMRVWTDDPGAADAWRNSWVAAPCGKDGDLDDDDDETGGEHGKTGGKDVEAVSVTELKDDEGAEESSLPDSKAIRLFAFRWGNITLSSELRFSPPATMKDVADYFTVASRPLIAGIENDPRTYTVRVDASAASRIVRPIRLNGPISAYDALSIVCRMNGCLFKADGQTVTISAEIPDGEMEPPDLDALLAELEAKGFANVADAEYTGGLIETEEIAKKFYAMSLGERECDPMELTWTRHIPSETNRVDILVDGCHWLPVERSDVWLPDSKPRLDREIGLAEDRLRAKAIRFANILETDSLARPSDVDESDEDILMFLLHVRQTGRREQSDRMARLLFLRPASAREAISRVRRLTEHPEEFKKRIEEKIRKEK